MHRAIYILCIVLVTNGTYGQAPADSVKTVIKNLFTAMLNSDTLLLKSCFTEGAILQSINKKTGVTEVKSETIAGFIKFVGSQPKGTLDERIKFDVTRIDGDLAIVWTPYSFYYKTVFSHCGVNSFQLVRIAGSWKIQYLIDTRRKEDCK